MLAFLFSALAATLLPWVAFTEKDKRCPDGYTVGRLAYFGWILGTFALAAVFGGIGIAIAGGHAVWVNLGWGVSLAYMATRRLRDMGASPWFALLGLVWPASFVGHLALCFIPSRGR